MNGIDSICAVLTLIFILVLSPLVQFKELTGELKTAVVKDALKEDPPDAEYIAHLMKFLERDVRMEIFTLEGKRNGELYPYIFRERLEDPGRPEEGIVFYGF